MEVRCQWGWEGLVEGVVGEGRAHVEGSVGTISVCYGTIQLYRVSFILFHISPLLCFRIELLDALAKPTMILASLVGAYGYFFFHFCGSGEESLGQLKHLCNLLWRYPGFGAVLDEDEAIF